MSSPHPLSKTNPRVKKKKERKKERKKTKLKQKKPLLFPPRPNRLLELYRQLSPNGYLVASCTHSPNEQF